MAATLADSLDFVHADLIRAAAHQACARAVGRRDSRNDALAEYRSKRDLGRSPEPSGERRRRRTHDGPIFVVHKHAARSERYDFRLEVDGVLKSWAVPKGPSTNPRDKRLAIRVEDHPLEYADFEGVIPEGQYGAGAVIVWDTGPYESELDDGHIVVELHGRKLHGAFALTRAGVDDRGRERWLLVKKRDEHTAAGVDLLSSRPESVLSGRTVDQVAVEAA
jgi:DNA ligase D-like protein (predicted 3'-phosphoesterase)